MTLLETTSNIEAITTGIVEVEDMNTIIISYEVVDDEDEEHLEYELDKVLQCGFAATRRNREVIEVIV